MPATLRIHLATCALALVVAGPAHADPTTDVANGTQIFIEFARAGLAGKTYSTSGVAITKPAGTLDFPLAASAIGLDVPLTLNVHGTAIGGNLLQLTFNDSFSPGVDVTGDDDLLTNATGYLLLSATPLPGAESPQCDHTSCPENVGLELLSSTITATGTWGSESIQLEPGARGVGGVPRARMQELDVPATNENSQGGHYPFCSSTTARTPADLLVVLTSVSPTGGTRVDLTWPRGISLALPNNITIPEGSSAYDIPYTVPASFVGSVQFTAAAGGAIASATLDVHAAADCIPPPSKPRYFAYVPPWLVGCVACSVFGDVNDNGWQITEVGSQIMVIGGGEAIPLSKAFPEATAIAADTINDSGMFAGRATIAGVTQAYRANFEYGAGELQLIGKMTPEDIGASATVVGYRIDASGLYHSVYNTGRGVIDLPLSSSYGITQSRALHISDSGEIAGTYTDGSGTKRGYLWVNGKTTTLPVVGSTPALPVAFNRLDQLAVNGTRGTFPAAAIISASGAVMSLGFPGGYEAFEITSLNRYGWAVGNAVVKGGGTAAFAWIPGRGFVSLSNYATGLVADQALRITDANEVVVHGTASSTTDLYLLTL